MSPRIAVVLVSLASLVGFGLAASPASAATVDPIVITAPPIQTTPAGCERYGAVESLPTFEHGRWVALPDDGSHEHVFEAVVDDGFLLRDIDGTAVRTIFAFIDDPAPISYQGSRAGLPCYKAPYVTRDRQKAVHVTTAFRDVKVWVTARRWIYCGQDGRYEMASYNRELVRHERHHR